MQAGLIKRFIKGRGIVALGFCSDVVTVR